MKNQTIDYDRIRIDIQEAIDITEEEYDGDNGIAAANEGAQYALENQNGFAELAAVIGVVEDEYGLDDEFMLQNVDTPTTVETLIEGLAAKAVMHAVFTSVQGAGSDEWTVGADEVFE